MFFVLHRCITCFENINKKTDPLQMRHTQKKMSDNRWRLTISVVIMFALFSLNWAMTVDSGRGKDELFTTEIKPLSTEKPRTRKPAVGKPKRKVAVATYVHKGKYDRANSHTFEGMMDNIAVTTSQVRRFEKEMIFDVELMVFLTNTSKGLAPTFEKLGWNTRILDLPMEPHQIRNPQIADEVTRDGAIGIWEMIKLEAWRPSVVNMPGVEMILMIDTDIHIRKPFDAVFLPPMMGENATLGYTHGAWEIEKINGGYLVIRPDERSEKDYHGIYEVLREGDFRSGTGWKGKVGWCYGGRTIQGLLPYWYLYGGGVSRGTQMWRCHTNNMVNSDECKSVPPQDVISNHFTGGCTKPWHCGHTPHPLCKNFTETWWEDVKSAEKYLSLPHRRRCPGGSYESMGIIENKWSLNHELYD